MKKIVCMLLSVILSITLFGCAQSTAQSNSIKACDGYFDISAKELLTKVNNRIKSGSSGYPELPDYSATEPFGNLTEYYSAFDKGACLRVTENKSHKVVMAAVYMNMTKATGNGADYSGYYFGIIGRTINPSNEEPFKSIKVGNIAVNDIQSTTYGNIFCVVVKENGLLQCRMYPLVND